MIAEPSAAKSNQSHSKVFVCVSVISGRMHGRNHVDAVDQVQKAYTSWPHLVKAVIISCYLSLTAF